jgi:hypothetical protein
LYFEEGTSYFSPIEVGFKKVCSIKNCFVEFSFSENSGEQNGGNSWVDAIGLRYLLKTR